MYTNEDVKNYFDLQVDMLKFMKKKQCHIGKEKPRCFVYGTMGNNYYIIKENHFLYSIPKAFTFIEFEKYFDELKETPLSNSTIERMIDFKHINNTLKQTSEIRRCGNQNSLKFVFENGDPVYIASEFFKYVTINENTAILCEKQKTPIFFVENYELKAMALPIVFN